MEPEISIFKKIVITFERNITGIISLFIDNNTEEIFNLQDFIYGHWAFWRPLA